MNWERFDPRRDGDNSTQRSWSPGISDWREWSASSNGSWDEANRSLTAQGLLNNVELTGLDGANGSGWHEDTGGWREDTGGWREDTGGWHEHHGRHHHQCQGGEEPWSPAGSWPPNSTSGGDGSIPMPPGSVPVGDGTVPMPPSSVSGELPPTSPAQPGETPLSNPTGDGSIPVTNPVAPSGGDGTVPASTPPSGDSPPTTTPITSPGDGTTPVTSPTTTTPAAGDSGSGTTGSPTNLAAPAGFSASDLVFNDNFSGTSLDSNWNPYITSNAAQGAPWNTVGGNTSGPGGQFDNDYDSPSQISVGNGLTLTASQQSINGMNDGTAQTFPITSGAVSSYGKFEFDGGYLQISMKAPNGNGAWPGLWLLPGQGAGSSGDNFEIDMQEGGYTSGSANPNDVEAYHLHTPNGTVGGAVDTGTDLTSGYNTYGIDWVPGQSISWYVNGKEVAEVTSAQAQIPDEPMEVIMDNQVANSNASSWHTAMDGSTPSTMPMQIADVQLYQQPGSGDTVSTS